MPLCRGRLNCTLKSFFYVVVACVLLTKLVFLYHDNTSLGNTHELPEDRNTTLSPEMIQEQLVQVWTASAGGKSNQRSADGGAAPATAAPARVDAPGRTSPETVTRPGHNTWLALMRKATEKRFGRPRPPGSLIFNASSTAQLRQEKTSLDKLKKILFWNDFYGDMDYNFGVGQEPFLAAGCPVNTCYTTFDRERFKPHQLDAVVWHQRSRDTTFPAMRHPHTRYVYFMVESPSYKFMNLSRLEGVFNYTMTFKTDSDIYQPYGIFMKRANPRTELEGKNFAEGKTKMAVWFASHCGTISQREKLILTLGDLIHIDIFGVCGDQKACHTNGSTHNTETCYARAARRYKFYLAFENSLCVDYVTEKFFGSARYDIIPVVYGLAAYEAYAPPHSYINVLDFKSVGHLAKYLSYLDKNDTAYNEYFRWKVDYEALMYYKSFPPPAYNQLSWCQLCLKLHTDVSPQVHTHLNSWRSNDSCVKASSKLIQKFLRGEEAPTLFRK